MNQQRATAVNHIRNGLNMIFEGSGFAIEKEEVRLELNGWSKKEGKTGSFHWLAPIAYEDFKVNPGDGHTRLFHNMVILRVSLILKEECQLLTRFLSDISITLLRNTWFKRLQDSERQIWWSKTYWDCVGTERGYSYHASYCCDDCKLQVFIMGSYILS